MDGDGTTTPESRPVPGSACRASDAEEADFARLFAEAPVSLAEMFRNRVRDTPELESYRRPAGSGGWSWQTWAQPGQTVEEIAAGRRAPLRRRPRLVLHLMTTGRR